VVLGTGVDPQDPSESHVERQGQQQQQQLGLSGALGSGSTLQAEAQAEAAAASATTRDLSLCGPVPVPGSDSLSTWHGQLQVSGAEYVDQTRQLRVAQAPQKYGRLSC
jgi:hypothetical protein